VLHDATDMEIVVQQPEGSPDLAVVAAGVEVVDQNVIGTLKRAPADEGERPEVVIAGVVDAPDRLQGVSRKRTGCGCFEVSG